MSQVRYILGYKVPRQDSLHEQIEVLIEGKAGFKWQVRVESLCVCLLGISRRWEVCWSSWGGWSVRVVRVWHVTVWPLLCMAACTAAAC